MMHPYLERLGIRPEVEQFFRPFYEVDERGNLLFFYDQDSEHYGFAFHRIPATPSFWLAGTGNFSQARQVIICCSAMEAISWLNKKAWAIGHLDNLLFLSAGTAVSAAHIRWINTHLKGKAFTLCYGRDLLGRMAELKLAAGLRHIPVSMYVGAEEQVLVSFRSQLFSFSQATFSLGAFEIASGFYFHIPAPKPAGHQTFFAELLDAAGLNI